MEQNNPLLKTASFVATFLIASWAVTTDCCGFQFSMKSARTMSYSTGTFDRSITLGRASQRSHWAYRQRPSYSHPPRHRRYGSPGLNSFTRKTQNFHLGIYALPYYWGHHDAVQPPSIISAADYPSNITAYDAEFRGPSQSSLATRNPNEEPSVNAAPRALPEVVINPHIGTGPQRSGRSHFDLQQRLLESHEVPAIRSATAASNLQGHAEKSFQQGRYFDAAYYSDQAAQLDPRNGLIYLFSSQCNFAIGKYSVAILMLEKATTMLPESQWGYVAQHYDTFYGHNDYVAHTRDLANYLRRRPDDNRARTLLGYHYGCLGYKTTASKLFHQSLQTYRNDELAQRLIPLFGDPSFASTVVKSVDAPTPQLLDEPVVGEPTYLSSTGNPLIFLTPGPSVTQQPATSLSVEGIFEGAMEELPSPDAPFLDQAPIDVNVDSAESSILIPPLTSPADEQHR